MLEFLPLSGQLSRWRYNLSESAAAGAQFPRYLAAKAEPDRFTANNERSRARANLMDDLRNDEAAAAALPLIRY